VVQQQTDISLPCALSEPPCGSANANQSVSSERALERLKRLRRFGRKGKECPVAGFCSGWPQHSSLAWPAPSSAGWIGSAPHMGATRLLGAGGCFNTEIYGELRGDLEGIVAGREWSLERPAAALAVLGQRPLSLRVLAGCHRAGSISQTCSLTHPYHSLHACLKSALELNSTTLFIPQAANSSSISQPGPKGLR